MAEILRHFEEVSCNVKNKARKKYFSEKEILDSEDRFINVYTESAGKVKPFLFLLKFYKGHYGRLLLSVFFYILKSCPTWAIPIITADVIDIVTLRPDNAIPRLIIDFIIAVVLLVQNVPTHVIYMRLFSKANRSVEAGLRGAMIRKLQQLSISFHKDTESGRIQSKVMYDAEAIAGFSNTVFNNLLSIAINMTITLIVVITNNITVFFMFLLIVPVAVLIRNRFTNVMRNSSHDFRKKVENTAADVFDMEELIPVTRAHSLEDVEIKKLTGDVTGVAESAYKFDLIQNIFGSLNWSLMLVFQIICLFFTCFLAFKGEITVGEISLYQSYFGSLSGYVLTILSMLPAISRGAESMRSVGEILSAYDVEKNSGKPKLTHLDGKYEFKNVTFNYDRETHVLKNLDLTVNAGETIALVGESGSGKSTIINLVIGFNIAESGQLLIDGKDITSFDMRSYRKMISVVPQNSILFSGSVRENITYGSDNYTEEQINAAVKAAQLESVIEKLPLGLNTAVGEHGAKLSGGQRQRIAIARAIIRDPKVIIFDEATSALDSVTEREIQDAIDNLTRDRTTFIVAHRLSTIKNADKIAVIKEGKCVEFGTYDELIAKKGEFYNFKEIQSLGN